jgi:hypothetical protein
MHVKCNHNQLKLNELKYNHQLQSYASNKTSKQTNEPNFGRQIKKHPEQPTTPRKKPARLIPTYSHCENSEEKRRTAPPTTANQQICKSAILLKSSLPADNPPLNPDSEEGTTKVTKQHEIRSPWGSLWLFQNAKTSVT